MADDKKDSGGGWLDSMGESLLGVWDSAGDAAGKYMNGWAENANKEAASAAPEENRVAEESIAQEPTGQVATSATQSKTDNYIKYGLIGLGAVAVLGVLVIALKD